VQFRILGPIEVELDGGRAARVPRGRARSLLALLLVRHGAAVHADRIADELWDGAGPEHARNAVQVVASRLRAALGEDLVVSRGGATRSSSHPPRARPWPSRRRRATWPERQPRGA
jgi:DNA-binding SARP family transcriptional activator